MAASLRSAQTANTFAALLKAYPIWSFLKAYLDSFLMVPRTVIATGLLKSFPRRIAPSPSG